MIYMRHVKTILSVFVIGLPLLFAPRPLAQSQPAGVDKLMFHHNRERSGWNDRETVLTPQAVTSPAFGLLWESQPLDAVNDRPPRLFAAPLYVHSVEMTQGPLAGRRVSALYVVTTSGYAYAINASQVGTTKPGEILWRQRLTEQPCGSVNLSTPVIDLPRNRIYMTVCSGSAYRAHALDIRSGQQLPGWPVVVDASTVDQPGIQKNGNTRRWAATRQGQIGARSQRGALNLNADGSRLYLTFGEPGGWIISIDTVKPRVASAFSSTAVDEQLVEGGIWASGGPSIDDQGNIYVSTGTSGRNGNMDLIFEESPGNWGQSILQLRDDPARGFELVGTYTPFNYCVAASWDVDLASSGVVVINLDPKTTSTPRVIAHGGGKQGNVYLVNRAPMPGGVTKRPPCSENPESDMSLLAPDIQPQFGKRGPIHVFPPYAENKGYVDQARSRSTLAYFRDASGNSYVYVTGAAKTGEDLQDSAPPGLAKLQIVTSPGKPAFMRVTGLEKTQTLHNASSPIVTSNGGRDAIVWVLDTNGKRSAPLYGPDAPLAVLYAFDAATLKLLWKSAPGQLATTGKYNEPTVLNGVAYVGTDRIQAFGLRPQNAR